MFLLRCVCSKRFTFKYIPRRNNFFLWTSLGPEFRNSGLFSPVQSFIVQFFSINYSALNSFPIESVDRADQRRSVQSFTVTVLLVKECFSKIFQRYIYFKSRQGRIQGGGKGGSAPTQTCKGGGVAPPQNSELYKSETEE